jgi:mannose-6-phosphate isomerase-like protein (cupin superfamily)
VTEPKDVTMLEKHQLKTLSDAVSEVWKNVNFAKVNGHDVRLRVVTDRAANFHAHEDSDELFCCLEGTAHLDTVDGMTVSLKPHELVVVPRNTTHRLRVEGRAVMLIIDAIKG